MYRNGNFFQSSDFLNAYLNSSHNSNSEESAFVKEPKATASNYSEDRFEILQKSRQAIELDEHAMKSSRQVPVKSQWNNRCFLFNRKDERFSGIDINQELSKKNDSPLTDKQFYRNSSATNNSDSVDRLKFLELHISELQCNLTEKEAIVKKLTADQEAHAVRLKMFETLSSATVNMKDRYESMYSEYMKVKKDSISILGEKTELEEELAKSRLKIEAMMSSYDENVTFVKDHCEAQWKEENAQLQ